MWSALAIGLAIVVIAVGTYMVGRPDVPISQLMYLPILFAASIFELPGAIITALIAGFVLGPYLPYWTNSGDAASNAWLLKSSLFMIFGVVAGVVSHLLNRRLSVVEHKVTRLSEMYTRILSSLALTVEIRDRHTRGHCERVARNAVVLGRKLGFEEADLEIIYWSGVLHDLGKVAVPESILLKPTALTQDEYEEIKRHPEYGAELLEKASPEFDEIAQVVRSHHERWDGLGYPFGLKAQEIPVMSRIITVIDVFEALTSERPYRHPMSPSQALTYIKGEAGHQFDPEIVASFVQAYEGGEIELVCDEVKTTYSVPNFGALTQLRTGVKVN